MAGVIVHGADLGRHARPVFPQRAVHLWLYVVPTMMSRIWRLPADARSAYDLSSLRTVWHLAAPCPAWLKEAVVPVRRRRDVYPAEVEAALESHPGIASSAVIWLPDDDAPGSAR